MAAPIKSSKTSSQKFEEAIAEHGHKTGLTETQKACTWQGELGLPYLANAPDLVRARLRVRRLLHAFNSSQPSSYDPPDLPEGGKVQGIGGSADDSSELPADVMGPERRKLFAQIIGVDDEAVRRVEVEPPFWCDYGTNIKLEGSFYCNFNTTILDCAEVRIGTGTVWGPNVHVYAGTHSVAVTEREEGLERALPVRIGRDVWIGGNCSIMAGVTIGDGVTVGAGSVVTRDIPSYSVAVGNPARVIKTLTPEERGKGAASSEAQQSSAKATASV